MRKILLLLTLVSIFLLPSRGADPVKVACVGNSITYGAGIAQREKNSYPAQLASRLGSGYRVENFGVSATTLLSNGNYPYISTAQYKASLDFLPNVVLIKLGTNDTKSYNRDKIKESYKSDYQKLIDSYRALPSNPRVVLMLPVACYTKEGDFKGANTVYQGEIIPIIEQLAFENDLDVIDLYHVFGRSVPRYIMPDDLHPSAAGARMMVDRIEPVVRNAKPKPELAQKVAPVGSKEFNFHGYKGYTWDNGYKIVEPRHAIDGNSWVLRARFWGHEPQLDIALLERGFHIAYCPVEDLYGAPKAVGRYDAFYKKMVKAGFSPKVVLEGMSRGGLIVYNWAARNPEKVAAIYADAPVMDIKSWPMGKSEEDTKNMLAAYGFKSEKEASAWMGNPIDHAAKLTGIPIIHVVGEADDVVPVAENTNIFKDRYQNAGGFMTVIRKEGVGHHPHSLLAPKTIVDFILLATGNGENRCVTPQAGREWRSGAGWRDGSDWWAVSCEIDSAVGHPCDVLMIGNSITQGFGGRDRKLITGFQGERYLTAALGDSVRWVNAGISGDRTENLLFRLQNGNYGACKAKVVFITIGVNNLNSGGDDPLWVARGVEAVAREASVQFPRSRVIVFGPLPYSNLEKSKAVHDQLSGMQFADNVKYCNPWDWFVSVDGTQIAQLYTGDKLHLSPNGYEMWSKKIGEIYRESVK